MSKKCKRIAAFVMLLWIPSLAYARADKAFYHAIQHGAMAKLTVNVVDDIKHPIGGVKIDARFDHAFNAKGEVKSFITDTNGVVEISGRTGRSVYVRATKDGYYGSTEVIEYITLGQGVKEDKWQPWNMTRTIILRPIKNLPP